MNFKDLGNPHAEIEKEQPSLFLTRLWVFLFLFCFFLHTPFLDNWLHNIVIPLKLKCSSFEFGYKKASIFFGQVRPACFKSVLLSSAPPFVDGTIVCLSTIDLLFAHPSLWEPLFKVKQTSLYPLPTVRPPTVYHYLPNKYTVAF